jgi:hypothetical protein
MMPPMLTAPVARRSSAPAPLVVTVMPALMVIVVKLWTPGGRTVFVVGAKAPSAPVLAKMRHLPAPQVVPPVQGLPHAPQSVFVSSVEQ